MPRPLSNPEWAAFMSDVQPDNLGLPDWGGIANWGGTGQYVLMFKMPSGEWALTDITDGIPYGNTIIPAAQYLQNVPTSQPSWTSSFIYSIPPNFAQVALEYAAKAGALATQGLNITADEISAILEKLLKGISTGVSPIAWPLAVAAVALLFLIYGKKGA